MSQFEINSSSRLSFMLNINVKIMKMNISECHHHYGNESPYATMATLASSTSSSASMMMKATNRMQRFNYGGNFLPPTPPSSDPGSPSQDPPQSKIPPPPYSMLRNKSSASSASIETVKSPPNGTFPLSSQLRLILGGSKVSE